MQSNNINRLKFVVVGDSTVGKTSLILRYASSEFLQKYIPTAFDNIEANVKLNDREIVVDLCDTAGEDGYEKLRCLSYKDANIVFICYSLVSQISFQNVKEKWYPEVKNNCKGIPIILIGTKLDLRQQKQQSQKSNKPYSTISYSQGLALSKKIDSIAYYECSSLEQIGINNIFQDAIKFVNEPKRNKNKKKLLKFKCLSCFSL